MAAKRQQIRRQHVVSKFYLKGFAANEKHLTRVAVSSGMTTTISVNDATVIKDFYSVDIGDGVLSDFFEREFSEIEDVAAVALRSALGAGWPLEGEERDALATWIALQHFRSEGIRDTATAMRAQMIRLLVGMSGKQRLRHHIESAEGMACGDARLEAEWTDLTQPDGTALDPDVQQHMQHLSELVGPTAQLLAARPWTLTVFGRKTLLTGDHPVSLLPNENHPSWSGIGVANAGAFLVPLSRWHGLHIDTSSEGPDDVLAGTSKVAASMNGITIANAARHVYRHPDDEMVTDRFDWHGRPHRRLLSSFGDSHVREEGYSAVDFPPSKRPRMPVDVEGSGVSLADLEWPILRRRFVWTPP